MFYFGGNFELQAQEPASQVTLRELFPGGRRKSQVIQKLVTRAGSLTIKKLLLGLC